MLWWIRNGALPAENVFIPAGKMQWKSETDVMRMFMKTAVSDADCAEKTVLQDV